ncbi:MAG: hypothetical protein ABR508_10285, partial [Candidatus Baltobacteraceae bacterium]
MRHIRPCIPAGGRRRLASRSVFGKVLRLIAVRPGVLFAFAAGVLLLVMLAPVIAMLASVPPAGALAAFAAPQARAALQTSISASLLALGAATVLGIPAGYALAAAPAAPRALLLSLLALPLAFPPVASGIMLLQTVGLHTVAGAWLASHGVVLVDSLGGVALAQFFVAGSFVAITAAAAFAAVDPV